MTNTFWIGANVLMNLETGETSQVLQYVFLEEEATTFTEDQARATRMFVEPRSRRFADNITWKIEKSAIRPGFFVIKGEQNV